MEEWGFGAAFECFELGGGGGGFRVVCVGGVIV